MIYIFAIKKLYIVKIYNSKMKKYFISNKFEPTELDDCMNWDITCYIIYLVLVIVIIYFIAYSKMFSTNSNPSLTICVILIILLVLYKTFY